MYPERCIKGQGQISAKIIKKGKIMMTTESTLAKGYAVFNLDSLEKGTYNIEVETEWNVQSDI